jgi:hypothetical protein
MAQQGVRNISVSCVRKATTSSPSGEMVATDSEERQDSGCIYMAVNSKQKGARYEREVALLLRKHGYEARRSVQYSGRVEESADVIGLPYMHIECKHYKNRAFDYEWLDQARRDAKNTIPIVIHRTDNHRNLVTMDFDDWMQIYREFEASMDLRER